MVIKEISFERVPPAVHLHKIVCFGWKVHLGFMVEQHNNLFAVFSKLLKNGTSLPKTSFRSIHHVFNNKNKDNLSTRFTQRCTGELTLSKYFTQTRLQHFPSLSRTVNMLSGLVQSSGKFVKHIHHIFVYLELRLTIVRKTINTRHCFVGKLSKKKVKVGLCPTFDDPQPPPPPVWNTLN